MSQGASRSRLSTSTGGIGDMQGGLALPRLNGELVFQAPWEGRAFGLAVALNERGFYQWREFVDQLIPEIAAEGEEGGPETYYDRWLTALERLLVERGIVTEAELGARTAEYASGARAEDWA